MIKATSRIFFRIAVYGAATLVIACGIFLYRGQGTLLDLVSHTTPKGTEVYSRWLDLTVGAPLSQTYLLATLHLLGYEKADELKKSGQYRVNLWGVDIWTRGFEYPDQTLSAQQIHLSFLGDNLHGIEIIPGHTALPVWRLEPKRLARWSVKGGASQPQIHLQELPAYVPAAVIAIEDKRFYHHGAIDLRGLARAVWVDLRERHLQQGGSTISQQLSRSIFLSVRRSWARKLLEAGLAFYLEARYSKSQLLEMYLNQVYWGQDGSDSLLGLESASRSFFNKPARELTLAEGALLAGLLQSPNHYSPRADPRLARERRNLVLSLMFNQALITQEQFTAALKEPLKLAPVSVRAGEAPYFVSTLQESLSSEYSLGVLMTQGWRVFTTLDPVLQAHATAAMHPEEGQGALTAIDPRSGAVRAWVGGTDFGKSTFDRVIYARRQPGSAFKPFVMLAAIDSRLATEATMLEDKPIKIKTPQGDWAPQNYDRKHRGSVSVWDALVLSLNVPTVQLIQRVGPKKVADYARRLGIQSPLREVPSLALGTSEVTVMELTSAYAALANGGRRTVPYSIEAIVDGDKQIVQSHSGVTYDAVPEMSAFIVTHMLQAVFTEGTARQAQALGFTHPAAGKTGTSENNQDAWFIGYTPALVCGVWVGHDQPKPMGRAAAGIALPVWTAFMQKALAYGPDEKFPEPKDLSWKTIDPDSGDLARSGCSKRRKEVFLPGTEPVRLCGLHPGGLFGFLYRLKNK